MYYKWKTATTSKKVTFLSGLPRIHHDYGLQVKLIPVPVMIGFCNGLALVIGLAQISNFKDFKWYFGNGR